MIKIEDNFLEQKKFDKIQNFMWGDESKIPWFYGNIIDYPDDVDKFQFFHLFYRYDAPQSPFLNDLTPIVEIIKPLSTFLIKANLLTRTPNIVENEFHIDIANLEASPEKLRQWTTSIFYINTNNGYTEFQDGRIAMENTKVESVANRMVTFPSNLRHRGTSCTDKKTRIVINFNYFNF